MASACPPVPYEPGPAAARAMRSWAGPLGAAGILTVLLWRLGSGPFLDGLRRVDGRAVAAAGAIGLLSTVCSAARWRLVAGGLGLRLPLGTAVADCYRSVFLNATLPGGVVGDVHRAVSSGRAAGDVGRGVRAVVWERTAGQVVQAAVAVVVLCTFPSPVRSPVVVATGLAVAAGLAAVLLVRAAPAGGPLRWARVRWAVPLGTVAADIRAGLLGRRTWPPVALLSAVAVAGHVTTFLIAARVAGSAAPLSRLVPLALLALLAMGVPANVAGFGPREGVAAWAFGGAGLTAAQGVGTAVAYGVLVLVSSLPGAAVLAVRRLRLPAGVAAEGTSVG